MQHRSLLWVAGIVAAATISACARTNAGLTTEIKTKLAADTTVQAHEINVDSERGVVTLRGTVDTQAAKDRAIQIARETKGVVNVKDMLTVRTETGSFETPAAERTYPEGAMPEVPTADSGAGAGVATIDDAAVTMNVKQGLLQDPMLKGLQIDVDTRSGVVYLTGDVTSEKVKLQLIKVAKEAQGVKDVQVNVRLASG